MSTRSLQRRLYLAQRTLGDVDAARRGPRPLITRIVKRAYHRELIGLLRRGGVWR